jgi:hypothetical protein
MMSDVYQNLGLSPEAISWATDGRDLLTQLQQALAAGHAVTFATNTATDGLPVIGEHAYMVDRIISDAAGRPSQVVLRTTWAPSRCVTLTTAQALKVFWFACAARG